MSAIKWLDEAKKSKFYVDQPDKPFHGKMYCHLGTDGSEEDLMGFAKWLGLRPEWIQKAGTPYAHFDLSPQKRAAAVGKGEAIEVANFGFVEIVVRPKKASLGGLSGNQGTTQA